MVMQMSIVITMVSSFLTAGTAAGVLRAKNAKNARRAERMLETYKAREEAKLAKDGRAIQRRTARDNTRREIEKLLAQQQDIDLRWFEYEVDVAKLLDFPMMTDMRAPLTVAFHDARRKADMLRPAQVIDLLEDATALAAYRKAVDTYVSTFEQAETEAVRRRRSDFSESEQDKMERAQRLWNLANDESATAPERRAAYEKATKELEGIIVLPKRAVSAIEGRLLKAISA